MTLRQRLEKTSNDYSQAESSFFVNTGSPLIGEKDFPDSTSFPSVSVIIPAYKAHKTLPLVLEALSRQTYIKKGGFVEVIVVDDASNPAINIELEKYNFDLKLIRLEINMGAGYSRDIAIQQSSNDLTIFIDADIIIPVNFISNHVFAHVSLKESAILLSFRENVSPDDSRLFSDYWKASLYGGDHRSYMKFRESWVMRDSERDLIDKEFRLLEETNYFKDFGNGRKIELWTLPMMVLTCSMSVKSAFVKSAIPSPKELRGWGFNDTCLAAKMIGGGGLLVIPLLNSNVLHILDSVHTKDDTTKNKEYLLNEKVYEELLDQE